VSNPAVSDILEKNEDKIALVFKSHRPYQELYLRSYRWQLNYKYTWTTTTLKGQMYSWKYHGNRKLSHIVNEERIDTVLPVSFEIV